MLIILLLFSLLQNSSDQSQIFLPIDNTMQLSADELPLTNIGQFGLLRSERPGIPAHLHTGIDIKRPGDNYTNEPIYPIAKGAVISKRDDGPFAQLIIEHTDNSLKFWTVYEHIAGIMVAVNDSINPETAIARFMDRDELNIYGWQFDHFHFEVLKIEPIPLKANPKTPERFYNSYTLICYNQRDLNKYFYNPIEFLKQKID